MSISGVNDILAAYQYANKAQNNNATGKTGFANKMAGADTAGSVPFQRTGVSTAGQRDRQAVSDLGAWNHEL